MAKTDDAELGADFKYILRLVDSDVDGLRPIAMGLTGIKGVGMRTAIALCDNAGVSRDTLGGHLSDEDEDALKTALEAHPEQVPIWMLNRQRDFATGDDRVEDSGSQTAVDGVFLHGYQASSDRGFDAVGTQRSKKRN